MLTLPTNCSFVMPDVAFWLDGSGAQMAVTQHGGIPSWVPANVLREIETLRSKVVRHVMLNKLTPGVIVPKHCDPGERFERWHLPIKTNRDCWYWDARTGRIYLAPGFWHGPVEYWEEHQVGNEGATDRVHLVVDL